MLGGCIDHQRNVGQGLSRMLEPALPDHQNPPPQGVKLHVSPVISPDVATELLLPERLPRLRRGRVVATGMAVPEATMHENGQPVPRKHQVRGAGQVLAMKAEAVPEGVEVLSKSHLGLRITALDASHDARTSTTINHIHHFVPLSRIHNGFQP